MLRRYVRCAVVLVSSKTSMLFVQEYGPVDVAKSVRLVGSCFIQCCHTLIDLYVVINRL